MDRGCSWKCMCVCESGGKSERAEETLVGAERMRTPCKDRAGKKERERSPM